MAPIDEAEINRRFSHHVPDAARIAIQEQIRANFRNLATGLTEVLPESREKSLMVTALEEAMFWANAAVARDGR